MAAWPCGNRSIGLHIVLSDLVGQNQIGFGFIKCCALKVCEFLRASARFDNAKGDTDI